MTAQAKSRRSPGRPTASGDRDARELLLTTATELFAERGVAGTTFALIAQRAVLTPAMLHYYFKTREQLLDAVVEERLAGLIGSVWGPVEDDGAPAETIRGVVERMLAGIERMPWVPSVWMREVLNEGGLLRARVLRHLPFDKVGIVRRAIARGQARGDINPDLDPGMIVLSILGLVILHLATARFAAETFGQEVPTRAAMGRHITGLLLRGLHRTGPLERLQETR